MMLIMSSSNITDQIEKQRFSSPLWLASILPFEEMSVKTFEI